jgi:hypothetical protein
MSPNNVWHLISKTNTTMQHFATLHHTSPNYTSQHLSTLHFLSFTLLFPLICLNTFTFPIALFHLTSLNRTQYSSHLRTYFQNYEPLYCPKEPLTISLHFTSLHFTSLPFSFTALKNLSPFPFTSLNLTSLHFTSLHSISLPFPFHLLPKRTSHHFPSLHFTSLHFTSLHFTSLPFSFFILFIYFSLIVSTLHFYLLCY